MSSVRLITPLIRIEIYFELTRIEPLKPTLSTPSHDGFCFNEIIRLPTDRYHPVRREACTF